MSTPFPPVPALDWPEAAAVGSSVAGGKGWTLGRLDRYGLPVPPGFVLPAAWSLGRAPGAPPSPALVECLSLELDRRGWTARALAVRSSATAEDSAAASFAGIHRSCLNVVGAQALAEAVVAVWDSLWTPQARAYRTRLAIADDAVAMAVVVMPLVPAETSGILFTRDPLSGRRDRVIIHANWGLGESLVAGETTGDAHGVDAPRDGLFDGSTWTVTREAGLKEWETVPRVDGSGTESRPVDRCRRTRPALADDQARALALLARDAADALDYTGATDHDMEWAWDGHRFWLLQARPITASARHTYAALADQPTLWTRGNGRDVMPDPLSPADVLVGRILVDRMLTLGYRMAGYEGLPGLSRAALFHGRLYLDASVIQWEGHDSLGIKPMEMNFFLGGPQPEITPPTGEGWRPRLARLRRLFRYIRAARRPRAGAAEALAATWARSAAARREDRALASSQTLAAMLRRHVEDLTHDDRVLFLQASAGASLHQLGRLLERHFPGEGRALAARALGDAPLSVTAAQGLTLAPLARAARADETAWAWVTSPGRKAPAWERDCPPGAFKDALARALADHGHRAIKETYLGSVRWREDPGYLLDLLPLLADRAVEADQERRQHEAVEAHARMARGLPFWARRLARGLARQAARELADREAARNALVGVIEVLRLDLLAIGAAFARPDGLPGRETVFDLTLAEALALAEGRLDPKAAAHRAADRRPLIEAWAREREPAVLEEYAGHRQARAETPPPTTGAHWPATALSQGLATGRARIARRPTDALDLEDGDILVAPATDPAWTPLFLKAGGVILETGGYLSHGAIVAREFGIPAVANLAGVLDRLTDGALVTVDGDRGRVILGETKDPP